MPIPFAAIFERAALRKGGEAALRALLPPSPDEARLARLGDDRVLAQMTQCVFSSGFSWSLIERKWPDFEAAFLGFEPARLLCQPPDFWDGLMADRRIVRNGRKIMAVAANARFVLDVAAEWESFGRFLSAWPVSDQVGLLALLARCGARLGGRTGQYFLRFVGKDGFVLSRDVVACLRDAGLAIAEAPTAKRDLRIIQRQFNIWADQSGLPVAHISRICALSIGVNAPPGVLVGEDGHDG